MLPETLTTTPETKSRLRLPAVALAAPPRATCASRHEAITRDLSSYTKYKRWAENQRQVWPSKEADE
jgi:hypothetical protein